MSLPEALTCNLGRTRSVDQMSTALRQIVSSTTDAHLVRMTKKRNVLKMQCDARGRKSARPPKSAGNARPDSTMFVSRFSCLFFVGGGQIFYYWDDLAHYSVSLYIVFPQNYSIFSICSITFYPNCITQSSM